MRDEERRIELWTRLGLFVLLLFAAAALYLIVKASFDGHSASELMDTLVKGSTIIGGAAFFAYKAASGTLATSTSLTLSTVPVRTANGMQGAVTLTIERGENYSVKVCEIYLRVNAGSACEQRIAVQFKPADREIYYLSPKEKTQLGAWVPLCGELTTVEAVIKVQQQYFPVLVAYFYASTAVSTLLVENDKLASVPVMAAKCL